MIKEINYNTFPRSGTMTLRNVLKNSFPDCSINFGFHLKSMIKNNIISLRNPYDSIESLIEFSCRYEQFNESMKNTIIEKRKVLFFDFETGQSKYEMSSSKKNSISEQIYGYSVFYCSFMEEIKKYKEEIFVISFENLISSPNQKIKTFAKIFQLPNPVLIEEKKVMNSVPKIHLPRKKSKLRNEIRQEMSKSKEIKNAYNAYKEVYEDFCI